MLKISKSVEYSILALKKIHLQNDERILTAKDIAESENIPSELLAKLLQRLKKNGILISVQGKFGGYKLIKNPKDISLFTIVEAIGLDIQLTECMFENANENDCSRIAECYLRTPLNNLQNKIVDLFKNLKLSEIIN